LSEWYSTGEDATHTVVWDNGAAKYTSDTTSPQLILKQNDVSVVGLTYRLKVDIEDDYWFCIARSDTGRWVKYI